MILQTLTVGLIQTNCYIVGCEQTKEGVIIDPGGHPERILRAVREAGLRVRYVLNTHCHFDHMAANAEVVAAWFGVPVSPSPPPDLELVDGQTLEVGMLRLQVLHTPGHSPGSVTFYLPDQGVAFDGDVLFAMGVGRTDLPGGDWDTLMRSIGEVLFALPDETVLYPGHGPKTTVGQEKRFNPWLL
jgi:glyoxylase-like metal-dependent hydrolase (beta-lactamase superfamily II)